MTKSIEDMVEGSAEEADTLRTRLKQGAESDAFFDLSLDLFCIAKDDGHFNRLNLAWEKCLGYSISELLAKPWLEFVHPEDVQPTIEAAQKMQDDNLIHFENRYRHKDGSYRWLSWRAKRWNEEGITYAVVQDITKRKQLEEQLKAYVLQAQKIESIGQLTAGIAHDFNNILAGILGYAELVARGIEKGNYSLMTLKDDLLKIISAARRGTDLTQQLRGFSKQAQYNPRDTDINSIVQEASKLLESGLVCALNYKLVAKRHINADGSQLHQVVQNLVLNARDAMPEGGTITITTEDVTLGEIVGRYNRIPTGSYVKLSISDTGMGMDEDVLGKLFSLFFTTKENGTGLGLSMVWNIVKNHRGYIDVKTALGKGTTFDLYFPVSEGREILVVTGKIAATKGKGKILIVDDEDIIRNIARRYLVDEGYVVVTASSGPEAIEIYQRGGIDLVITDSVMKPLDGLQLLRKLREINPQAKVYAMSGFVSDVKSEEMINNGALDFIPKPFDQDLLIGKVNAALSQK